MYKADRILTLAITLLMGTTAISQNTPKTLLWRISGNGLLKPSYLFGTMHLTDKRLFNFSDSVYQSIENSEGFAVEIDFREYMDSMFMSGVREAEDKWLEKQSVKLQKEQLDKGADSLLKQFGIEGSSVNKKQLKKIRDYRMGKIIQRGEMETIVDGFLYGIAQKSGKWLGAVEDVSDQLNLSDELGGELSPEQVFIPENLLRNSVESMIKIYLKQDLDELAKMSNAYSKDFRDLVLIRRNIKMAARIDSLTAIRSMFVAVGAAHLPGEDGIIQLLIKKGFRVEPVLSENKIPGSQYIKKLSDVAWHTVSDEEIPYSVMMPGKPSDHDVFGQAFKMKMLFDITTMSVYMSGHIHSPGMNEEKIKTAFEKFSSEMAKVAVKPKIIRDVNFVSYEGSFSNESGGYRIRVLYALNHIYFLMAGTGKISTINSTDIKKYFDSFKPKAIQYKESQSTAFTIPEKAFTIRFPGQPQKNTVIDRKHEDNALWEINSYDFIDNKAQKYYLLQVRDIRGGNYITSDSTYFEEFVKELESTMTITQKEYLNYKNYPALKLNTIYPGNIQYEILSVIKGGRIFMLMVGGQKEQMNIADSFFQSLEFLEFPPNHLEQTGRAWLL